MIHVWGRVNKNMYDDLVKHINEFMQKQEKQKQRTTALLNLLEVVYGTNLSEKEIEERKGSLASMVRDKSYGFDEPLTLMTKSEVESLLSFVLNHATMHVPYPVNVNDTVYIVENNEVIPCIVKIVRYVKTNPEKQPMLELYLVAINNSQIIKGCEANILNTHNPSGNTVTNATWVNDAMCDSYWFYDIKEALAKIKKDK